MTECTSDLFRLPRDLEHWVPDVGRRSDETEVVSAHEVRGYRDRLDGLRTRITEKVVHPQAVVYLKRGERQDVACKQRQRLLELECLDRDHVHRVVDLGPQRAPQELDDVYEGGVNVRAVKVAGDKCIFGLRREPQAVV